MADNKNVIFNYFLRIVKLVINQLKNYICKKCFINE